MNIDLEQQQIFLGIVAALFVLRISSYLIIRSKRQRQTKTPISGSDSDILGCLRNDYPAVLVTVFGAVYSDPKIADLLGLDGLKALNPFLDSLTE